MDNGRNGELERRRRLHEAAGGEERSRRQHARGKLLARERIGLLFDDARYTETGALIEGRIDDFDADKKRVSGDGVITAYGKVHGRTVFAAAGDFTVHGGTMGEYHLKKICVLQDMAMQAQAPLVFLLDGGGARIEEGISSLCEMGGMFFRNVKASGMIPQIAACLGPCAGGACYSPALCDFIFMTQSTANMFLTGPNVVKAVIGEDCTQEELGSADVHARVSGVSHATFANDQDCLQAIRMLLTYLPQNYTEKPQILEACEPETGCDGLVIPEASNKPYDIRNVIKSLVDAGSLFEIQREFAANAVVTFARINGKAVGIVANQPSFMAGVLNTNAADKIARFVRFCDCFNIPLITLVDVPAFMPGTAEERKGIIRHGAKMLYAYSEATVSKVSVILRKAIGGAYIAMGSKLLAADAVFAWPGAQIAVMGAEGAASIIYKKQIGQSDKPQEEMAGFLKQYGDRFMNPYIAAQRGYVDEVILPDETRVRLIDLLQAMENKKQDCFPKKHGNIPL